jgi:citrate lyase alpha subunit
MSIKIEKVTNTKFVAKGLLKDITTESFVVEDIKEGVVENLTFAAIRELLGKDVVINISAKEDAD